MPYSVGLYFDTKTNALVRDVWKDLFEDGVADYYHVSGNRPHITLVMVPEIDLDQAVSVLRDVAERQPVFPLAFQQIGIFPGSKPVVFWGPVITEELLRLQRELYDRLAGFSSQASFNFYKPDHWIPHCGLAMEIADEGVVPAIVQKCFALPNSHPAQVKEIGLISFRPVKEIITLPLI